MEWMIQVCFFLSLCLYVTIADPEFCNRGFQLSSRFYKCWEQSYYTHKYAPLGQQHDSLNKTFFEAYVNHMCSVVKPQALECLHKEVKPCDNFKKLMEIADKSGGACERNYVNPYFKDHVIEYLVPVASDSQCFTLADNTYQCYRAAGDKVMKMGGQVDDIVTFHKVADTFFDAYWDCMVKFYKSNVKVCPHWQIPMLLTVQKTAMPSLFGLRLQPSQIQKLELGDQDKVVTEVSNPGPSSLYLLLQLHHERPDLTGQEDDSVVLELSDLNDENPRLTLESENNDDESSKNKALTLKQIKNMLREQRRRNKELRDFITQAQRRGTNSNKYKQKDGNKKKGSSSSSSSSSKSSSKSKGASSGDKKKKGAKGETEWAKKKKEMAKSAYQKKKSSQQKKLNADSMVQ